MSSTGVYEIIPGFCIGLIATFAFECHKSPENRPDRGTAHAPVLLGVLSGMALYIIEHGLEVLDINEQEFLIIGDPVHNAQDVGLQVIELQDPGHEKRSHLSHCRSERDTVSAVNIPESHGISLVGKAGPGKSETRDPLLHIFRIRACSQNTGKVSLYIGHKHRNAQITEGFRKNTRCHGLARTGSAGNQTVPVRHARQKINVVSCVIVGHPDFSILQHCSTS